MVGRSASADGPSRCIASNADPPIVQVRVDRADVTTMTQRRRFLLIAASLPLFAVLGVRVGLVGTAPELLFGIVVVAASLCVVTSIGLLVVAHHHDRAELGFVATCFYAVSLLPLVHGLTVPGVLYGENAVTMTSVFLAVPFGLLGLAPSVGRTTAAGRAIARRWRSWVAGHGAIVTVVAVTLLARPDLHFFPEPGSTTAWFAGGATFAAAALAGWRHAWLADVAGRAAPMVIGVGLLLVGSSAFAFIDTVPFSFWFWAVHALDITGVFLATIGGVVVHRRGLSADEVIAPVVAVDPHAALELGLSPIVERFVADLRAKDQITRDHVVRTADLAVEVALELGLDAEVVRRTGTAALLHDVGKLEIPMEILGKPGRLTDDEFAVMRTHTEIGDRLLATSPGLESLAPSVRGHHERFDGTGYPDRLDGVDIPIEARIVSACDAHDAMANTRHYRTGMEPAKVRAILLEHSGSQWDPRVVDALLRVLDRRPADAPNRLDGVGDALGSADREFGCECLPEGVLATVDA